MIYYIIYCIIIIAIIIAIILITKINIINNFKNSYNNKYLICYPGGGLCDMLNIINKCLIHSEDNNRKLIIDTTKYSWFKHNIHDYILFNHPNIINNISYEKINDSSIYPPELKGKLKSTIIKYKDGINITEDNVVLSIDLEKKYTEDIIVYSSCGGGIPSKLINYIQVNPIILDVYYKRLNQLPNKYISIHIRNTDYKSNVDEFIALHDDKLKNNKFFLATDDIKTIDKCKLLYGMNVMHFSNIPDNNGKNIHDNHTKINQQEFIIDNFVDLLLLASSNEFYFSSKESGYSKFANHLFINKNILNSILSQSEYLTTTAL